MNTGIFKKINFYWFQLRFSIIHDGFFSGQIRVKIGLKHLKVSVHFDSIDSSLSSRYNFFIPNVEFILTPTGKNNNIQKSRESKYAA